MNVTYISCNKKEKEGEEDEDEDEDEDEARAPPQLRAVVEKILIVPIPCTVDGSWMRVGVRRLIISTKGGVEIGFTGFVSQFSVVAEASYGGDRSEGSWMDTWGDASKKNVLNLLEKKGNKTEFQLGIRKPAVAMIAGVDGGGKTTSLGKLAYRLKKAGEKILMAAGDTFRAAPSDQLEIWAEGTGCEIVVAEGEKP
ncbi:hypothetical protein H0E87_004936 [Populus deltoides]|uniref:SRP54-type proteins GTP-binding domain-containing protein n=1 Tax=Populus deltoides TaxID=3696 RepID=A0A8T2ZH51_POPDE|nr:hypothetical protein H0E87_004936 [Populus deltoides]